MTEARAADELAGERPVSGLAVAALLAGCGSALVLFTSLAAMLPLVAVVLAVVAIGDLARSEGRRVGRSAALVGMALAIGFAAQVASGFVVDRWIGGRRAAATVAAWTDAVREARFADAIGLCSPGALPSRGHDHSHAEPPTADATAEFKSLPAVSAVAACGPESRPAITVRRDVAEAAVWVAEAELSSCGRSGGAVRLLVGPRTTTRGRAAVERWLVTGFELVE
jgi:hypothetical protein